GYFADNIFHGHGSLELPNGALYEGDFRCGVYHGRGKFHWPDGSTYSGDWHNGEMEGRGTLSHPGGDDTECFVYVGEFVEGEMQGCGCATFPRSDGEVDQYKGDFQCSRIQGCGSLTDASGSRHGSFESGCTVGEKIDASGQVFRGSMARDVAHGPAVMYGAKVTAGFWHNGACQSSLRESLVSAKMGSKVFSAEESAEPNVAGKNKQQNGVALALLPGAVADCLTCDAYAGQVEAGKKHGHGIYVYADDTAFKGEWSEEEHPRKEGPAPEGLASEQ
ncbi:unnamed protein product, partial [Effrenium voratum]